MATVKGKTSLKIDDLINDTIISGYVSTDGNLILTSRGGAEINAGFVGSQRPIGDQWIATLEYAPGDIVSYAGILWKALNSNTNKPPALYTSLWMRLTGEIANDWTQRDPYFNGDDYNAAWNFLIKTGSPVVSFTSVPGEFESGTQALKVSMALSEIQWMLSRDENIVRGSDKLTVLVRARLLSSSPAASLDGVLLQSVESEGPDPGSSDTVLTPSLEGPQNLTTAWTTYPFRITCVDDHPRAMVNLIMTTTGAGGAVFLIDYVLVVREEDEMSDTGNDFEIEQLITSASNSWVCVHGQGTKAVNVYTEDSLGNVLRGDVSYPDDNSVQVDFYYAQTGLMRVFN